MGAIFDIEPASKAQGGVIALHGPREFLAEGVIRAEENSGLEIKADKFFNIYSSTPPGYQVWAMKSAHFNKVHPNMRLLSVAKVCYVIEGLLEVADAQHVSQGSSFRLRTFRQIPLGHHVEMELDAPQVSAKEAMAAASHGVALASAIFGTSREIKNFADNPSQIRDNLSYNSAGVNFRIGAFGRLKTNPLEWGVAASRFTLKGHAIQAPDMALACIALGVSMANPEQFSAKRAVA